MKCYSCLAFFFFFQIISRHHKPQQFNLPAGVCAEMRVQMLETSERAKWGEKGTEEKTLFPQPQGKSCSKPCLRDSCPEPQLGIPSLLSRVIQYQLRSNLIPTWLKMELGTAKLNSSRVHSCLLDSLALCTMHTEKVTLLKRGCNRTVSDSPQLFPLRRQLSWDKQ